ncbi:MAG TPA: phage holin family protein [Xanthobacteraceae bacterium]|nr:phage holin family protein [Xanthobacteraceae bacterium]
MGPLSDLKASLDRALTTAALGVVAAVAAVAAFFFVCVGIFVWTANHYDTVTACAVLAVLFLVIAAIAVTVIAVARRRAAEKLRQRERRKPQWWLDPTVMAIGLEAAKTLGPRRIASLAVLGALVAGIMLNRPGR